MVPATKLQSLYNKLYIQLRKYIWDFKTVEALADFEISVYRRFPDISDVERKFNKLIKDVTSSDVYRDDEDLKYAIEDMRSQLDDTDQFYADLITFREVVETDEDDDQEESEGAEFNGESEELNEESEESEESEELYTEQF